jgi:hypothetical protein
MNNIKLAKKLLTTFEPEIKVVVVTELPKYQKPNVIYFIEEQQ